MFQAVKVSLLFLMVFSCPPFPFRMLHSSSCFFLPLRCMCLSVLPACVHMLVCVLVQVEVRGGLELWSIMSHHVIAEN